MIIPFRVKGWILNLLQKEKNRSEIIRIALEKHYSDHCSDYRSG